MLNFIRGLVRPYLAMTGWTTLMVIVTILALRFADKDIATIVLTSFMELVGLIIGFWFGARTAKQ